MIINNDANNNDNNKYYHHYDNYRFHHRGHLHKDNLDGNDNTVKHDSDLDNKLIINDEDNNKTNDNDRNNKLSPPCTHPLYRLPLLSHLSLPPSTSPSSRGTHSAAASPGSRRSPSFPQGSATPKSSMTWLSFSRDGRRFYGHARGLRDGSESCDLTFDQFWALRFSFWIVLLCVLFSLLLLLFSMCVFRLYRFLCYVGLRWFLSTFFIVFFMILFCLSFFLCSCWFFL